MGVAFCRALRIVPLTILALVFCAAATGWRCFGADRWAAGATEPRLVAHRGLLRHAPENTLAGFRACLELRIGFELDIQRSRDGRVVVIHDDTVDRTTDGTGSVANLTLAELGRLDAGTWFHPAFAGQRIPTLDEVLALVAEYDDAGVLIAADLKSDAPGIEAEVVQLVRKHGVGDRVLYIGRAIGNPEVRRRLREADPRAHAACLANEPEQLAAAIADRDSDWVYVRFLPTGAQAQEIHRAGKRAFIAGPTVGGHEADNWRRATGAGVDAVLTDYPLAFRKEVGSLRGSASAAERLTAGEKLDRLLRSDSAAALTHSALGVTRRDTPIPCLLSDDDLDVRTPKTRILLVGGLDGSNETVQLALSALKWFYKSHDAKPFRASYAVSAVPCANPDAWAAGTGADNTSGGDPTRGYPPEGVAYRSPTDPEAAYLWRWIGMHAPDLVVEMRSGKRHLWKIVQSDHVLLDRLATHLKPVERTSATDELFCQLPLATPSNVGTIPAVQLQIAEGDSGEFLPALLGALAESGFHGPSPARCELWRRLDRAPLEVARQLSRRYGHELNQVAYIPALALIGRLRLGELTNDSEPLADVERIVLPYRTGDKAALLERTSGSNLSGHLVFGELARMTGDQAYVELARAAADLGFDAEGNPKEAMPAHLEMSDSVFMGGPILAQVGRLTGEAKYFEMCVRHLRFMRSVDLRADGLYRHSPFDEAAWGRGNGFPALGLALCLTDFPKDHPDRAELAQQFRGHLKALASHQDPTGAWHQVIDVPGSYRELTSTCMITFAMIRGIRLGVLDRATYEPLATRAWRAIRTRVALDGTLVDVCTGTGKQKTLRDYFDRTAILGPDARGGAMALMVTTELAQWEAEGQ